MKISRYAILFINIFLLGMSSVYAGCDGWFSFSSECEVRPNYCQGDECGIREGVNATKDAVDEYITTKPISQYAQDIVTYLLSFISLVAVCYIIYGGFTIVIGGGDEEKLKKTKNIILYVIIGILLIWLSFGIVKWVINLTKPATRLGAYLEEHIHWGLIQETSAAYSESTSDTFKDYQGQIKVALENLEAELRINKAVNIGNLQTIKSLVQSAYDRLPDNTESATINATAKRAVDMYLDIAIQNPRSTQKVGEAISKTTTFINSAKISQITGTISSTPGEGNAPLTVSFLANGVTDPSGTTPSANNYIWWIRENGGIRRELGRGPSLMYTFTQEGAYTINLDVISGSRNSKGKTDVLPLSTSQTINVKPKLGEIVLLINGVNVSNIDSLKIHPTLGKMGIILDATASRAIGNGSITKTYWKFGNGNEFTYEGKPIVERQVYGNQGAYPLEFQIETNDGKKIAKKLQLVVRDPSAVIQMDESPVHIGEPVHLSALSYFTSTNNNVEYSWQIQDDNNQKVLKSAAGKTLDYSFNTIGKYIITLNARSANGSVDSDSRTVVVESREPIVNLESPIPISKERPNTIIFNAEKSYDPDTRSSRGLTYTWRIDGQKIDLNNTSENGSKGTLTFGSIGSHTVSLTVSNAFGKVSSAEKTFSIDSTLALNLITTPQVAPIGTSITLIAQSENADFYEWNFGDGTPPVSSGEKVVQHSFQKTGNYTVTLNVSTREGGKTNQTQKKVYITDTNSPLSIIEISNASNTAYEDMSVCGDSGAIIINRSEATNLSSTKSVNIDGSTSNLSYTWNYFGNTKTTPAISEKFGDLGCFPIKLTVRSNKNGAIHSTTQMIYLRNQPPELTSITTNVDASKKDNQKVLVKVNANGATDKDGVITSYIWYYTTESDKEPQNIQITQKPEITFVLPNITEKYYFGVILEDNDGARTNSSNDGNEQTPLIISNENGNIYLPLITFTTSQSTVLAGQNIHFSATAKTIVGADITGKSEYAWDFDGDGKIDQKTTSPNADHVYDIAGNYVVKVRVTYNGVSNTKYQTIYVKNELKAQANGYRLPNGDYYFLNSSQGVYDKAVWKYAGGDLESLYSVLIEGSTPVQNGSIGTLTVSNRDSDTNTVNILTKDIEMLSSDGKSLLYQSSPRAEQNTIHLKTPTEKVLLSMLGNPNATHYAIDTNTKIDSNLDGITDNDIDNIDLPSYNDGSIFVMKDLSTTQGKDLTIKLTTYQGTSVLNSQTIHIIFDSVIDPSNGSGETFNTAVSGSLNEFDRIKLDELAALIRGVDDTNRLILMKKYNVLVESWNDTFSKSKTLIELQTLIDESTITSDQKNKLTTVINDLLSGESQSTNDIVLAARLINGLVSKSEHAVALGEKLSAIESHPQSYKENVVLAKEIFDILQTDSSIDAETKKYIYNQLGVIKNGGGENIDEKSIQNPEGSSTGGFLGFVGGVVQVFFFILLIVVIIIAGGYAFYRVSRKNTAIGFQDFLIDSIFHAGKPYTGDTTINTTEPPSATSNNTYQAPKEKESGPVPEIAVAHETSTIETEQQNSMPVIDPMTALELNHVHSYSAPPPVPSVSLSAPESILIEEPVSAQETQNPDVLNPVLQASGTGEKSGLQSEIPGESSGDMSGKNSGILENAIGQNEAIPDWLKMPEEIEEAYKPEEDTVESKPEEDIFHKANDIPDWLKTSGVPSGDKEQPLEGGSEDNSEINEAPNTEVTESSGLPDWLVDSVKQESQKKEIDKEIESVKPPTESKKKRLPKKQSEKNDLSNSSPPNPVNNIPDWLK